MTIRVRLAIWYFSILLLGLLWIAAECYYEMSIAHPEVATALATKGHTPAMEVSEILALGGLPALTLALVGGWFLMCRAMEPVATLTRAVERVEAETLHQRLPRTGNNDELDRLSGVFNAMMARLNDSFLRVREFTFHASHELKTPLTIMRGSMELALREGHGHEMHRELLANQLEEIQRLTRIVDSLGFLAKADAGHVVLQRDGVRFNELLAEIFGDAQILAEPQGISVVMDACDEVVVRGDRDRLRQLLLNLTDNAIKYNHSCGRVVMSLRRNNGWADLRIDNTGSGIEPEKLPRLFDRFFRGDLSHNGTVEGNGLGLCIASWIVRAHGGHISMSSEPAELTRVSVRLPVQ